jgi:hypothetical protein
LAEKAGEKFGKVDENIAKGLTPEEYVQKTIKQIYLRESEVIGGGLVENLAMVIKVIIPDLLFWVMSKRKAGELKKMRTAKQ